MRIGVAYVDVRVNMAKFKADLDSIERQAQRSALAIKSSFSNVYRGYDKVSKASNTAAGGMDRMTKSANKQKRSMMGLVPHVAQVTAAYMAMRSAWRGIIGGIGAGAQFEQKMGFVHAISTDLAPGFTNAVDQFEALKNAAKAAGEQTVWTAIQAGDALKYLTMAGFNATESIEALKGVLDLALIGELDLGRATDIVTDTLNAMNLETKDLTMVNDVFVATVTRTNTNIEMMGNAMKFAAPVAGQLGYDIQELSSYIGILAQSGVKAGIAGRNLQQAFVRTTKAAKTFNLGPGAKLIDVLKKLNEREKEYAASMGKTIAREKIITQIRKAYGMISLKSVLILKANIKAQEELEKKIRSGAGETAKAAAIIENTTISVWKKLVSVVTSISIDVWEKYVDTIKSALKSVTGYIRTHKEAIGEFVDDVVNWTPGILAFTAALATMKIAQSLIAGFVALRNSILAAEAAATGLGITLIANPLILVAAALFGSAVAFIYFDKQMKEAEEKFGKVAAFKKRLSEVYGEGDPSLAYAGTKGKRIWGDIAPQAAPERKPVYGNQPIAALAAAEAPINAKYEKAMADALNLKRDLAKQKNLQLGEMFAENPDVAIADYLDQYKKMLERKYSAQKDSNKAAYNLQIKYELENEKMRIGFLNNYSEKMTFAEHEELYLKKQKHIFDKMHFSYVDKKTEDSIKAMEKRRKQAKKDLKQDKYVLETKKKMYKALNEYYPESKKLIKEEVTLIENKFKLYGKLQENQNLIDAYSLQLHRDNEEERLAHSKEFFDGIKLGYMQMVDDQMTMADAGLQIFKDFSESAQALVSKRLFDAMTGDLEDFQVAWRTFTDSLLRTFTDIIAKMIVEAAIDQVVLLFKADWVDTGSSALSLISSLAKIGAEFFGGDSGGSAGRGDGINSSWSGIEGQRNMAYGGFVPGGKGSGDSFANDTYRSMLSPGEYVVPRSQTSKIAAQGQHGDTLLAHINPEEAALLMAIGGSGTINPATGLPQFSVFSDVMGGVSDVMGGVSDFMKTSGLLNPKLMADVVLPIAGAFFGGPVGAALGSAFASQMNERDLKETIERAYVAGFATYVAGNVAQGIGNAGSVPQTAVGAGGNAATSGTGAFAAGGPGASGAWVGSASSRLASRLGSKAARMGMSRTFGSAIRSSTDQDAGASISFLGMDDNGLFSTLGALAGDLRMSKSISASGVSSNEYRYGGISRGPESGYNATLHGDEAVVPLQGGGTIPVEIVGGSQGATFINKGIITTDDIDTWFANRMNKTQTNRVGNQYETVNQVEAGIDI